jgi:Family of unknown function (DUF6459)
MSTVNPSAPTIAPATSETQDDSRSRYDRIQWNHAHRAPSIEEMFGWQHTEDAGLADPDVLLKNVALGAVECLAGVRNPEQIERWLMPAVFHQLLRRHTLVGRRHSAEGGRAPRSAFRIVSSRLCRVNAGVAEGSVVVSNGKRARAVAIRFEALDHRWRATELRIL